MHVFSDIHRARLVLRRQNALDVRVFRHARGLLDLAPRLAAVFRNLHQPIVSPDVDQAFDPGRFGDRAEPNSYPVRRLRILFLN